MNLLLEQLVMLRAGTAHLADLALHSARSLTPEELVQARAELDGVCGDLSKIDDAFSEFEGAEAPIRGALFLASAGETPHCETLALENARRMLRGVIESGFDEPEPESALLASLPAAVRYPIMERRLA